VDSKYKWSVKISTFIETIYLKGLLIRKGLVSSLNDRQNNKNKNNKMKNAAMT